MDLKTLVVGVEERARVRLIGKGDAYVIDEVLRWGIVVLGASVAVWLFVRL